MKQVAANNLTARLSNLTSRYLNSKRERLSNLILQSFTKMQRYVFVDMKFGWMMLTHELIHWNQTYDILEGKDEQLPPKQKDNLIQSPNIVCRAYTCNKNNEEFKTNMMIHLFKFDFDYQTINHLCGPTFPMEFQVTWLPIWNCMLGTKLSESMSFVLKPTNIQLLHCLSSGHAYVINTVENRSSIEHSQSIIFYFIFNRRSMGYSVSTCFSKPKIRQLSQR